MGTCHGRHVRCGSVEGQDGRVPLNPLQIYVRRASLAFGCGYYALDSWFGLEKQAS